MPRPTAILLPLLVISLGSNLFLATKVTSQRSTIESLAERPSGLDGPFIVTVRFSATDAVSGEPIDKVEFRGASRGGGISSSDESTGVSAAFDSQGGLVLFGHGSEPFDVSVGSPGYESSTVKFSPVTPDLVEVKLIPETP